MIFVLVVAAAYFLYSFQRMLNVAELLVGHRLCVFCFPVACCMGCMCLWRGQMMFVVLLCGSNGLCCSKGCTFSTLCGREAVGGVVCKHVFLVCVSCE